MCGRYVLRHSPEELQRHFEFEINDIRLTPRFNIAPTTPVPMIRVRDGHRELFLARWGLAPSWWSPSHGRQPPLINARCETVRAKPVFRSAFKRRRCIVPASGYYEWQSIPGKPKQPVYIASATGEPLAFAGLWELAETSERSTVSATILTRAATPEVAAIHDRMPLLLSRSDWERWMAPEELGDADSRRIFEAESPYAFKLTHVSRLVNSVANEGVELLTAVAGDAPQPGLPDLFS